MVDDQQLALGYWPDTPEGMALWRYKIGEHLTKTKNVLENFVGQNGVKIYKDGDQWVISLDYGDDSPLANGQLKAWDIAFTESGGTWTATTSRQVYNRGGATIEITPDLTMVMPASTSCWIARKLHTVTGVAILVNGTTLANTVPTSLPSDTEVYSYRLLYQAYRPTTDDPWKTVDYRTADTVPLYG